MSIAEETPAWCDPTLSREERIAAVDMHWQDAQPHFTYTCPICSDAQPRQRITDRYGFDLWIAKCEPCQLSWNASRPDEQWFANFYRSQRYRELVSAYHGRDVMTTIHDEQRKYADSLYQAMKSRWGLPGWMELYDRSTTMLDIGGGTGIIAKRFVESLTKDYGYARCYVCDPEIDGKPFEEVDYGQQRFDVVLMCQTIDHLLDPRKCLDKVRAILSHNRPSLFFVDILDTEQEVAEKGWQQTLKIDHPFYMTDKSARLLLAATGFEIVDSWESARNHIGYLCKGRV